MNTHHLPTVARWLLTHFSPNNDGIIGDLDERYRAGRSRLWYWRQVFVAIAMNVGSDIRVHTFLAVRGVVMGWILTLGALQVQRRLIVLLVGQPWGSGILPASWTHPVWHNLNGWPVPQLDAYLSIIISCMLAFVTGALIGRIYGLRVTLLYVMSWLILLVVFFPVNAMHYWLPPVWLYLALGLFGNFAAMASNFAGAILSARHHAHDTSI